MSLSGDHPWHTPSGGVVRCDEVLVGRGAPIRIVGLADDELADHDAWARITIVEPEPEHAVWVHTGSEIAIGSEIWRIDSIVDAAAQPTPVARRRPGRMVTLTRTV